MLVQKASFETLLQHLILNILLFVLHFKMQIDKVDDTLKMHYLGTRHSK